MTSSLAAAAALPAMPPNQIGARDFRSNDVRSVRLANELESVTSNLVLSGPNLSRLNDETRFLQHDFYNWLALVEPL